jgi:hypothetical protein
MKNLLIASSLAVASFAALADGATYDSPQPSASPFTRAELRAALERWRTDGAYLIAASGTEIQVCEVTSPPRAAHWQASANESGRNLFAARNNTRQF